MNLESGNTVQWSFNLVMPSKYSSKQGTLKKNLMSSKSLQQKQTTLFCSSIDIELFVIYDGLRN